jgi:hypothetical protein
MLLAGSLLAQPRPLRDIIGDAANIQLDAEALAEQLNKKNVDGAGIKAETAALAGHIQRLKADVDFLDEHLKDLTPAQQKDWDLAKTKTQLLQIFIDWKAAEMEASDVAKNRTRLRAHANGIAERARLLQRTLNRLDR